MDVPEWWTIFFASENLIVREQSLKKKCPDGLQKSRQGTNRKARPRRERMPGEDLADVIIHGLHQNADLSGGKPAESLSIATLQCVIICGTSFE
jgi:hypothetical protein